MKKIIYSIIILLFLNISIKSKTTKEYDLLLEWAKNHSSFYLSDKIAINYTSENVKNFFVIKEIEKNETLMTIPKEMILNIQNGFNLYGPKMKKLYEK